MTALNPQANSGADHALIPVPPSDRQSAWSLAVVLFGFTFFSATMMAGGQIGSGLGLGATLWGSVFIGNLLLATYASLLAVVAFRSGLSTVLMARFCFGSRGSGLADIVLGSTQVGWYAWGCDTVVSVLTESFQLPAVYYKPMVVLTGLGFCVTAAIGYKGLEVLSAFMVPLMTGLMLWSGYLALGVDALKVQANSTMGVATAVTIVVGTFVSGATQSTNWTRYARSPGVAVGVTFLAFFLGNGLMVGYGALTGSVYQNPDVVSVLLLQGFFGSALFMLLANIWTTQDNTIYNFSLAGCHLLRTQRRRLVTVVGALLGTVLALLGFAQMLVPFLLALGTVVPPLGGVILADFFVVRKSRYPDSVDSQKPFEWPGITAYILGSAAAWWLPGVAPVTGVVVGFLAHILLARAR